MLNMRSRRKHLLIFFLVLGIIIILKELPNCYYPVRLRLLFQVPPRLRRSTCTVNGTSGVINGNSTQLSGTSISRPHYITHGNLKGRTGNLMFQTAALFGIAHALNYRPYIDPSHPLSEYFEIRTNTELKLDNLLTLQEEECRDAVWNCRKEIYSHNLTITGWLQSWKYFVNIDADIREIFKIKSLYLDKAKEFLNSHRTKGKTVVGVHIRRGDFLKFYFRLCGYTAATQHYIDEALALYRKQYKNALFLIMSDDMTWCKENIVNSDIIHSIFDDPILDLALMSLCDHMIMTGGTFGWWGSWLAGGNVVYLKDWPRPGSWLDLYGMDKEVFFPPEWIGLSNFALIHIHAAKSYNTYMICAVILLVLNSFK